MSRLRRLLPISALALGALVPTASASVTEPATWQCGSTFTLDVSPIPSKLSIATQAAPITVIDADTITFPAPSPAFSAGPAYGVYGDEGTRQLGVYRNGCFSPTPRSSDRSVGITPELGPDERGPAAGGDFIVLRVFGDVPRTAQLYVGDKPATGVTVTSNGVVCIPEDPGPCTQPAPGELGWMVAGTTPPGDPGFVDLSIRDGDRIIWGQSASSNDYEYVAPPTIKSITPSRGPIGGGNSVDLLIDGDWVRDPAVSFGGVASPAVSSKGLSDVYDGTYGLQRITAKVPSRTSAGIVNVSASGTSSLVPGPSFAQGATATADDYTYGADRTPGITSVTPNHGPAAGGNTINIWTRFINADSILFGSTLLPTSPDVVGDDLENGIANYGYHVQVPPGQPGQTVKLKVGGVGGATETSGDYTYDWATVSGVSGQPTSSAGGFMTMVGQGLGAVRSVKVGDTPARGLLATPSRVYFFAPKLPSGVYPVTIKLKNGVQITAEQKVVYPSNS